VTEEDYKEIGNDLIKMFGDALPDPTHEPVRFAYYVKLYQYEIELERQRHESYNGQKPFDTQQ
jgi:hypothetical protein